MKNKQPDMIRKIAISVGKVSFLKKLFRPVYTYYLNHLSERRKMCFLNNGLLVLKVFDKCMADINIPYSLAFGTMLGAVREHGFIKHDLDIDIAIWNEDYSEKIRKILIENGFTRLHLLLVEDGKLGREETYVKDDVSLDIFYIYPKIDNYPYCCDFMSCTGSVSFKDSMRKFGYIIPRRVQLPWKKDFIRVPFGNLSLPIPVNAREILSFRYGPSYLTPNPQWHYTDENEYISLWQEKHGIMKE